MFVTPYSSEELYPSELHVNQNPGGEEFGLAKWVARDDSIENEDIVLWPCEHPFLSSLYLTADEDVRLRCDSYC